MLVTPRLSLRRPVPADIDAILQLHRDPRATAHNPADALTGRTDAEVLYARWDEHWQRHGFGYWALCRPDDGTTIGFCGVKVMRLEQREVLNLFYRLDPSAWGAGLATEAARAVLGWAAQHQPHHPVIARVRPANVASRRVAERVGLVRAAHLDRPGEDGLDWIYVTRWEPAAGAGATSS